MKVLIPVLSKKENNEQFLKKATKRARAALVFLPVDTSRAGTPGFTMGEISQGKQLMNQIKTRIGKMRKKCETLLEWGDTIKNIDHIARLKGIERIALVEQENEFFKKLLKELKKKKEYRVKIIRVPSEEE